PGHHLRSGVSLPPAFLESTHLAPPPPAGHSYEDHERTSGSAPRWTTHIKYGPIGTTFFAGATFGILSSSTPSLSVAATLPPTTSAGSSITRRIWSEQCSL